MRTSTSQFSTEINNPDHEPVTAVGFTWPATITGVPTIPRDVVESIDGQASYTTDMPEGTKLLAGYPARSCTMVLSGMVGADETQSAAWLFHPYSITSPLYGQDWTGGGGVLVTFSQGLQLTGVAAPEVYQQFVGYVDKVDISTSGQVTLSLVDLRMKISKVPALPMAIASNPANVFQSPGLTSLWPLDAVLRDNGFYSGPAPRLGCIWYMSGHGSLWPEVGQVTASSKLYGSQVLSSTLGLVGTAPPAWVAGMFTGQAPATFTETVLIDRGTHRQITQTITGNGAVVTFEGWVKTSAGAAGPIGTADLNYPPTDEGVSFGISQDNTGNISTNVLILRAVTGSAVSPYGTGGAGWHQVTASVRFNAGGTAVYSVWLDGIAQTPITISGLSGIGNEPTTVAANATVPVDTWQISSTTTLDPAPGPSAAPGMTNLDASLNNLTAIPAYSADDAWALIQQLADAEFAVAGLDETGIFFFRNRTNRQTDPVATIAFTTDLQISLTEASRVRAVSAQVHPLTVLNAAPVWQASANIYVAARGSTTVIATLTNPAVFIPTGNFSYGPPSAPVAPYTNNTYRAAHRLDYGNPVSNLTITARQISSQAVQITITNPNGFAVALIDTTTGSPYLTLVGQSTSPAPTTTVGTLNSDGSVTITSTYGTGVPAVTLADTVWRQDTDTVQQLTDDELSDLLRPRPIIDNLEIVGDPRLQLGDRIRLQDDGEYATNGSYRAAAALNDDAVIIGVSPKVSASDGFTQTLTVRMIAAPRQWVLGQAGRSEMGTTTWI